MECAMHACRCMRAGELCVRDVVTGEADEPVIAAARRMAGLDVGDLIVVDGRVGDQPRPVGIVTDRDLVVQVLARPDRDPETTHLGEVMQQELVTASEDDAVEDVVDKMRMHGIRRIPILDRSGGLQGVLSVDDIVGWIREQLQAATRVLEKQGQGPHGLIGASGK